MDFMKWLNSLDELLYEVMSWILFFPLTLWRAVARPLLTMREAEVQAALPSEEQYTALISPPLFLTLALLLAHSVATALGQTDAIIANRHGLASLVDDNTSALILRVIVFSAFPLFFAARLVRAGRQPLDRRTLRQPFYAQCYPTALFALGLSLGSSLTLVPHAQVHAAGATLVVVSLVYFVAVEVRWFARALGCGLARAGLNVLIGFVEGASFLLFVGFLFTR